MKRPGFPLHVLTLIAVLVLWLAGLIYLSSQTYLLDSTEESADEIISAPSHLTPAAQPGQSIHRISVFETVRNRHQLLVVTARSGPEFVIQLIDRDSQLPTHTMRCPGRFQTEECVLLIEAGDRPHRLRLDIRTQSHQELVLETVAVGDLKRSFSWLPSFYLLLGPILVALFLLRHRGPVRQYLECSTHGHDGLANSLWNGLSAFLIFVFCFLAFRAAPVQQLIDSKFTTAVSHYLMTTGTFSLPPEFEATQRSDETYILQSVGSRTYHFFSDAPSLLNIPFVAAFEFAGISSVGPDGQFIRERERRILVFCASFLAATLCALLFLTARLWLTPFWSVTLALVFAFGTQVFSVLSRAYWSHSWAVLLLATALYFLNAPRFQNRGWTYVLISTLLCWAYFCRPPLSLSIIAITIYVFLHRRRYVPLLIVPGLVWAILFVSYSLANFDSLLPPYFLESHLTSGRLAGGIVLTSYPKALIGTLFSPGRGLFVYVPFFLLVLFVVIRRWRWVPNRTLAATALATCFAHWQLVSLFRNWWGGQSFGPRLMSDILPWFFLLAVMAIAAIQAASAEGRFRWTALKVAAVGLFVAASIFVNTRGAVARETADGAGIWNWRYPQFMAGLIPRPDAAEKD